MDVPRHKTKSSKKIRWMRSASLATILAAVSLFLACSIEYLGNPWLNQDQSSPGFSMGLIPNSQHLKPHNSGQGNQVQVYSFVSDLLSRLPSGTDVDEADFPRYLTSDMVNYLKAYQVKHIKVVGNHVTADLAAVQTIKAKSGADVRLALQISFDVSRGSSLSLTLSNVQGIDAYVSWIVGWMTLEEMQVSTTSGGDSVISLQFSTRFGQVNRVVVIAPDGSVTVNNQGSGGGGNSPNSP